MTTTKKRPTYRPGQRVIIGPRMGSLHGVRAVLLRPVGEGREWEARVLPTDPSPMGNKRVYLWQSDFNRDPADLPLKKRLEALVVFLADAMSEGGAMPNAYALYGEGDDRTVGEEVLELALQLTATTRRGAK